MKVYRVTRRRSGHEHDGYSYFTVKAIADRSQKEENKLSKLDDEVELCQFPLTTRGVLDLLERFATHPDNG
jgi:hypothetical protein